MDIVEQDSEYLMNTYKKKICLEYGIGCHVFGKQGKKYLDLTGGIATCSIGHSNPKLVKAIANQAGKMINSTNLFYSKPQIELAKKLSKLSGLNKCFFCNSGTEAIEAAIKLAKNYSGKSKIIAMKNGFHGRTLGSLSATWNPKFKEKFKPLVPGFEHVEFGSIEALESKIDKSTAAVILEPIQGEAGVILPKKGYLKQVEKLCKKHNALMIVDEIQTGCGRTGKFFCFQHENVSPDIVTIAKGIANGLPLGAVISKKGIDFEPGDHGSTFGGNSLCCTASLKTIELIEKVLPQVEEKGKYFFSKLESIDSNKVKEVRGKGLMLALKLNEGAEKVSDECAKNGLLVNCIHGNILRFLPTLTITKKEIDFAVQILEKAILVGGNGK